MFFNIALKCTVYSSFVYPVVFVKVLISFKQFWMKSLSVTSSCANHAFHAPYEAETKVKFDLVFVQALGIAILDVMILTDRPIIGAIYLIPGDIFLWLWEGPDLKVVEIIVTCYYDL